MKRWIALLAAACMMLTACAAIPTSGDVRVSERVSRENGGVILDPKGPSPDLTPEQLVDGFLQASSAGFGDAFSTARQYLTPEAAAHWDPSAQVQIYPDSASTSLSRGADGALRVSVAVTGSVDVDGNYSTAPDDSVFSSEFTLVRDSDDQWRIAVLRDGIIMPETLFSSLFVRSRLYFLNPTNTGLVPDVRWFPRSNALMLMVQGVIDGPSRWLTVAAHSAIPPETRLEVREVVMDDGVARIEMGASLATLTNAQLQLFEEQLRNTITGSGLAQDIVLLADGAAVGSGRQLQLPAYPFPAASLVAVRDGQYTAYDDGSPRNIGFADQILNYDLDTFAVEYSDSARSLVAVNGGRNVMYHVDFETAEVRELLRAEGLVTPSLDQFGWAWSANSSSDGRLLIANTRNGTQGELYSEQIQGQHISALAVSRDGTRIALAYDEAGSESVAVFAIQRGVDGVPMALGDVFNIGQCMAGVRDLAWTGDARLVALVAQDDEAADSELYQLDLGGPVDEIPAVSNAIAVTAGRGSDSIVLMTQEGSLYRYTSGVWSRFASDISAMALPG
ncbi:MAG: LpqB family beta-propeller domain-containing protein [Actinomycetaceae bacterium]|nr:LpqB family beta-propeller domain-containing protein [Arcanobacterium sp.]MDD7505159.1 LpqB family beta-propeller domain-containing protein [Actinomycetaceae bacterium]